MSIINNFLTKAKQGQSVYLHDVRELFDKELFSAACVLTLANGTQKHFNIGIPEPQSQDEENFIKEYFYVRIYNIISILGGCKMTVYTGESAFVAELADSLESVFGVNQPKNQRVGYAKCLNVADRMNKALNAPPFSLDVIREKAVATGQIKAEAVKNDITIAFKDAVKKSSNGHILGIDVGGTDIKIVASKNGHIHHFKEYDWFPAAFETVDKIIDTVMLLTRLSRAVMSLDDGASEEINAIIDNALKREATVDEMTQATQKLEAFVKKVIPLDCIGLSFPDVVVQNKIVGGETYKTRGVREHSHDYEKEFAKLTVLNERLESLCKPDGTVRIANDGTVAAYASAVELAHSPQANSVKLGLFAHTLGTELGSGWIDMDGNEPPYPLEVYNCAIDLGNYPARAYLPNDVRSINNFNTGIAGTLQKFAAQSGAFRFAAEYYKLNAPRLYDELFEKNYITNINGGCMVATLEPKDLRKEFLEHLMIQAENGEEQARLIFEEIGKSLAATWLETESVLEPATKSRVLFGRFVKRRSCFELMLSGAKKILPDIDLLAADEDMAYTSLMLELRDNAEYTVAQFGQAVGAVYFAAAVMCQRQ